MQLVICNTTHHLSALCYLLDKTKFFRKTNVAFYQALISSKAKHLVQLYLSICQYFDPKTAKRPCGLPN